MSNNTTDNDIDAQTRTTSDTIIFALLLALSVATVASNWLVMAAILYERKLWKFSNYLVFSLSMADLLTGLLVMPIVMAITYYQYFLVSCEFVYIVESVINICSIYNVLCISIDRYLNIVYLKYSLSRGSKRVIALTVVAWFVPLAAIVLPKLVWPTVFVDTIADPRKCRLALDPYFKHFRLTINYYLPFGAIILMNCHIFVVGQKSLRKRSVSSSVSRAGSTSTCSSAQPPVSRTRSESRLRTTIAIIISAFLLCWCPFVVYVYAVEPYMAHRNLTAFHALFWLALSNSLVNALIYSFRIPEIWLFVKKIFCLK